MWFLLFIQKLIIQKIINQCAYNINKNSFYVINWGNHYWKTPEKFITNYALIYIWIKKYGVVLRTLNNISNIWCVLIMVLNLSPIKYIIFSTRKYISKIYNKIFGLKFIPLWTNIDIVKYCTMAIQISSIFTTTKLKNYA